MISRLRTLFPSFLTSILDSYTQVFFSNDRIFAGILVLVTFFDFYAGLSGLIAVVVSNTLAYLIGFNRRSIKAGYYGFNSLLVGLGMGIFYQPGMEFYTILFFVAMLTLFLTVMVEGILGKYGLPFLSISFLLGIWLITLASRQFSHLRISERDIYMMNDLYSVGGLLLVRSYEWLNNLPLHESILIYFRSLGAIFFQNHLLAGVLVSIGLLIYSRIAFLLSWMGFLSAYFYYTFIGASINELSYGYIGFNYILTAIAVGGFFLIPSGYSFLWVLLLTPLISILQTSFVSIFLIPGLSVYSLPFNVVVILFLYMLKFRERFYHHPELVIYQLYSPEKNLYARLNYFGRFGKSAPVSFSLPFWGKWKVTQAEEGEYTHQGDWKDAWDFEIADEKGKTFQHEGHELKDYYCYDKPVMAPADGVVEEIRDDVDDNPVGEINLEQNWGNTLVIRHGEMLYSQLSHLKKGSLKVAAGETVKQGEIIASCGNSGRSPVPHVHFQIQATPYIGSTTISYPLGHYILHQHKSLMLKSFNKPLKEEILSNIEKNECLETAFHFVPGQKMTFRIAGGDPAKEITWEVKADYLKTMFLFCEQTGSKAFFHYNGSIHYFTHFEGDHKSLLYSFYLGAWKVMTGFYPGMVVEDTFPLNILKNKAILVFQDFIAPFYRFMKADYHLTYIRNEDHFTHKSVWLHSSVTGNIGKRSILNIGCDFVLSEKGLESFTIIENNKTLTAERVW